MKVRLVAYTQPAEEFKDSFSSPLELVAYCARVSNPENQYNNETAEKLVRYLIKHSHWSPLEMVNANLEIETTRDIARQMIRHPSLRPQEFSQRYADVRDIGNSFVLREARFQDQNNRQNSIECDDEDLIAEWNKRQQEVIDLATKHYTWAVSEEIGIAKEQARVVLPEGNTVSRLIMQGSIRSWIHYIQLRSANGTQKEHMELAKAVAEAISKIFPMINEFVGE